MKNYVFPFSFLFCLLLSFNSCTKEEETPLNPDTPALQVDITPNPTTGPINISFNTIYQNIEIEASNVNGQNSGNWQFNNTNLVQIEIQGAQGLYFLKISADKQEIVIKVVLE